MDSNKTKYCIHCGKKIPKGIRFCPYCGTKQPNNTSRNNSNTTNNIRSKHSNSSNVNRTARPTGNIRHTIRHKSGKHKKPIKWIILAIILIIIVFGGAKLHMAHQHTVAIHQEVTSFRHKRNTFGWKLGVGTFLDSSHTRAQVMTSYDNFNVTTNKIIDTTPPNDNFNSDYILYKSGFVKLIGINTTAGQDSNLKVNGASNNLVTKSSTGHITYGHVDINNRDIKTVADSIGKPDTHNFIIFKAQPDASKGIKSNQFMVLIKK